jgi:FKBP12-rapamycin complex-associated protein
VAAANYRDAEVRIHAAGELRDFVASHSRELPRDASTKFYNNVNKRIFELCHSTEIPERIGGITALDRLIDYDGEENTTKVTRFANYLRLVLPSADTGVMILAAKAMGHLALLSGTLTGDFVDFEVKRALEYLQGDRVEMRRHAAVLAITELAKSTPTLIYAYIPQIIDLVWVALRDPKVNIRESAYETLSACLEILYAREANLRKAFYIKVLEEAQNSLNSIATEYIHGGLLAYRALLVNGGMFMHERYREICETTLKFKDHRDFVIRKTIIQMIATLAGYNPAEFVASYLHKFMGHLLSQLSKEKDRPIVFISIGQVAMAVGSSMGPYLESVLGNIREGLAPKRYKIVVIF